MVDNNTKTRDGSRFVVDFLWVRSTTNENDEREEMSENDGREYERKYSTVEWWENWSDEKKSGTTLMQEKVSERSVMSEKRRKWGVREDEWAARRWAETDERDDERESTGERK